jgi:hypothetical protein
MSISISVKQLRAMAMVLEQLPWNARTQGQADESRHGTVQTRTVSTSTASRPCIMTQSCDGRES